MYIKFNNINCPNVYAFAAMTQDNLDDIPQDHLMICNHIVSFNSSVINQIIINFSKSKVKIIVDSRNLPNADSDMKTFLVLSSCKMHNWLKILLILFHLSQLLKKSHCLSAHVHLTSKEMGRGIL